MERHIAERAVIDDITHYLHTDDILVIHGARQVGKTSILMYLQHQLIDQAERTLYIDLEDSRFVALLDRGVDEFLKYLPAKALISPNCPNWVKSSSCW